MKLRKIWQNVKRKWIKSSLKQPPRVVRTGYAQLMRDKDSKGSYWLTFGYEDEIGVSLPLNQPLLFQPHQFNVGTRVEIWEDRILLEKKK